ncbi:MAG TPA: extracellular solute-binding protein [Candidatus Paceibacterota bacterium]
MNISPKTILLGIIGLIVLAVVLIITGVIPGLRPPQAFKTELSMWGLEDDSAAWKSVIAAYQVQNSRISINYTGFSIEEYEQRLVDALAAGTGPDIFMFHNNWLLKHKNKIFAAPAEVATPITVSELFPQVVTQDFIADNQVYALPISIDTLALLYNKNIFDAKQIPVATSSWEEIHRVIPILREVADGSLSKPAIALGGSEAQVRNATDILSLIMMQFGAMIVNPQELRAVFSSSGFGLQGLNFYLSFSDPLNASYSWNEKFGDSITAFLNGGTAMVFAYNSDIKEIRSKNPILNFGVLPFPQLKSDFPVNLPSYWGLAVSNKTRYYADSWYFISSATTDINMSRNYINISGNPPALRTLINDFLTNPNLKVFAAQALTAKNWPHPDPSGVRSVFDNMIKLSLANRTQSNQFLVQAQDEINKLLQRR